MTRTLVAASLGGLAATFLFLLDQWSGAPRLDVPTLAGFCLCYFLLALLALLPSLVTGDRP